MLLSALSGCGAITGHQEEIDVYTKDFTRTNCDVNLQKTKIKKRRRHTSRRSSGLANRTVQKFNASIAYFGIAEDRYKSDVDEEGAMSKAVGRTGRCFD